MLQTAAARYFLVQYAQSPAHTSRSGCAIKSPVCYKCTKIFIFDYLKCRLTQENICDIITLAGPCATVAQADGSSKTNAVLPERV